MANAETEFAEYLSMESFFNAETMSQQNFVPHPAAHPQQNGDYFAPLEPSNYTYETTGISAEQDQKFDFHNNNNNVQYFYENNNSVQVQQPPAVAQHPEFYVSYCFYSCLSTTCRLYYISNS